MDSKELSLDQIVMKLVEDNKVTQENFKALHNILQSYKSSIMLLANEIKALKEEQAASKIVVPK